MEYARPLRVITPPPQLVESQPNTNAIHPPAEGRNPPLSVQPRQILRATGSRSFPADDRDSPPNSHPLQTPQLANTPPDPNSTPHTQPHQTAQVMTLQSSTNGIIPFS